MEFPSPAELRAIAVFSLLNLLFAQLLDQPPSWASSREKQQKRQNWRKDGAKVVVCHFPVSCLLSRAAVFPHEKLEQLITCSAAHVTCSSCSHGLPTAWCPFLHPGWRRTTCRAGVTTGEILWGSLSHPAHPGAGLLACPWAGHTRWSHLLLLYWQKWEKFCRLRYCRRGGDVWLAGSCCWFFSPFFTHQNNLDSWSARKGPLFSSLLITQLSLWSLMLLLWTLIKPEEL